MLTHESTSISRRRTLACLLGGLLGAGVGCPGLPISPLVPCASGENNHLDEDTGKCECRIGYEWCDPDDAENLDCCEEGSIASTTIDTESTTDTNADTDSGTCDGEVVSVPCMRRYEVGCPTPSNLGSFTAAKLPAESWAVDYDTQCEVVSSNMDGPTIIDLACDIQDNQTWNEHSIQIDVEPKWTPPAPGTMVRFRRYQAYDEGGFGSWHVWRLDELDSGTLIAAMMEDHSQGSLIEWVPQVEVIWDGCVDTCGMLHDLWVRVTVGCEVTTMFSGDQCTIDGYEVRLKNAQGVDCDETGGGHRLLDLLILKVNP
jgi:hypothetical protein